MLSPRRLQIINSLHPRDKAYDYQMAWAADDSKFKLASKARQIGITTTEAITRLVQCALWKPSDREPDPPVVIFCSPSQKQSNRLMLYVQKARHRLERKFNERIEFKKETETWCHLSNDTEIWSLPNNPHTVEGIDCSAAIIDEGGNFVGREGNDIYESLMGSLAAKAGSMTVFGKPRGRVGFFWGLCDPYGDYRKNYNFHEFKYNVRAQHDNRYAQAVLDQRKVLSDLAFKENYLCEFIDEGVVVIPYSLLDQAVSEYVMWSLDSPIFTTPFPVQIGIDFAKKRDQTAIIVMEHQDEKSFMRFIHTMKGDYDKQLDYIVRVIEKFKPTIVKVDETGIGQPLKDQLFGKFGGVVEGVQFTLKSKEKMLMNTKRMFEERRMRIPRDDDLIEQLHGIEKIVTEQGNIRYSGKRTETDFLDDLAWATFLANDGQGDSNWDFTVVDTNAGGLTDYEKWARGMEDE